MNHIGHIFHSHSHILDTSISFFLSLFPISGLEAPRYALRRAARDKLAKCRNGSSGRGDI